LIDQTQVQTFERGLFVADQRLYALLDGAAIPNLTALLADHQVVNVCLLPGELEPELAQAAPYLVQLEVQSPLTGLLLTGDAGPQWGILATSAANLRTLRMHFRKFLSVWDPDGKPLYFRYYDPRVLRLYLPTCDAEELSLLFGPVTAFYAAAPEPDTLLRFTFDGAQLGRQPLQLSAAGAKV
jgi:hypothetical protein